MVSVILDISTCFTYQNSFYFILFIPILVKPQGIPQCASVSYVIDLTELLINGWPDDGLTKKLVMTSEYNPGIFLNKLVNWKLQ
jgi:hypothetical protein